MNYITKRYLQVILIIVLIVAGTSISYNKDTQIITSSAECHIQEIVKGVLIEQEFIAEHNYLREITLFFATYERNNTGYLQFEILDNEKLLASTKLDVQSLENNAFHSVKLRAKGPIEGEKLTLRISSDAEIGNGISLWYNTSQAVTDGTRLLVNKQPLEGNLVMGAVYKKPCIQFRIDWIFLVIILVSTIIYLFHYLFKGKIIGDKHNSISIFFLSVVGTFIIFMISEGNSFITVLEQMYNKPIIAILNITIIFGFLLVLGNIIPIHHIGLYIGWTVLAGISIGSWVKLQLKGEPFLPWDIFSIKEGLLISQENHIDECITAGNIISALIPYYVIYKIKIKCTIKKYTMTSVIALLIGSTLVTQVIWNNSILGSLFGVQPIVWNQGNNLGQNKLPLMTVMNLKYMNINKPEHYTEANISEIMEQYIPQNKEQDEKTPNIILVMNESWADLRNIKDFEPLDEVMAEIDKYKSESLYGWALSSVIGGGTANAEYEVLTGQAAKFLPPGAIAYPMYVNKNVFSITKFLKEQGYYNVAIHPYMRTFWNREEVYNDFLFDEYYSDEIVSDPQEKNGYIADCEVVSKIKEVYKDKEDSPLFCFAVTMQNHQPYNDVNAYETLVDIPDGLFDKEVETTLEIYLSGVKSANEMFSELVEYAETLDEPTIVIMFGDHYPPLGEEVYEALLGKAWGSITKEELAKFYTTPFIAYKNYDKEGECMGTMSMFYLLPQIFKASHIISPPYFELLNSLFEESRGYTAQFMLDEEGKLIEGELICLKVHELLQYNNLKGKNYYYDKLYRE